MARDRQYRRNGGNFSGQCYLSYQSSRASERLDTLKQSDGEDSPPEKGRLVLYRAGPFGPCLEKCGNANNEQRRLVVRHG